MSYDELLSILQALEVEVFPPDSIVKQPGEAENRLVFCGIRHLAGDGWPGGSRKF